MNKVLLLLSLIWCGAPAFASALLKPTTGATQNLRAKSLGVQAEISGAFARATVTTIYANPNRQQTEADFIYTAPANAVVIGFAYWFKGEKVTARVVEKQRAQDIYFLFTRPPMPSDPALVEMIGVNTFRARIAPVEARADLKIEVQYIQPLEATSGGWKWSYPLSADTKNYPLDAVTLSAKVEGTSGATSNFGAFSGGVLNAQKTRVQDAADIEIGVSAPRAPLKVSLFAARDGGSDGFFALALAPDFSATKPNFAVTGVQTYDVIHDDNARAGQTFVAVGRYRGTGAALVKLGKRSVRVQFQGAQKSGNIAALLWGARRIETLSGSDQNRAQVVHLSQRFGMPSKWTSWLAVPASEKKAFEGQLLSLEINHAISSWAQSVAVGDKKREAIFRGRASDYQKRLNVLSGRDDKLTAQTFGNALNGELNRVIEARQQTGADKAKLSRLERALRARGALSHQDISAARERKSKARNAFHKRVISLHNAYLDALQKGESERAAQLLVQSNAALAAANRAHYFVGYDPRSSLVYERARQLATQIETERKDGVADSPLQQEWLAQLARLGPLIGGNGASFLQEAKADIYKNELQNTSQQLNMEVDAGRENSDKALRLKAQIEALAPFVDVKKEPGAFWNLSGSYTALAARQGTEYLRALDKGEQARADALLKSINENLEAARRYDTSSYPRDMDLKSVLARSWGDLKNEASGVLAKEIAAKRENSPAANDARKLIERADKNSADTYGTGGYIYGFMPKFAWQGRAHETAYLLIQARQKGDAKLAAQLQTQLQSEVENAGETSLDNYLEWEKSRIKRGDPIITSENYVLRPGDPLISVSAPANCRKVVAILPSGELLPLRFDTQSQSWQARFDVPTYASEGAYQIKIIIVADTSERRVLTMNFGVDTLAPNGIGGATFGANGLDLRLQTDDATDRVSAFTPWNERVELRRDASGVFGARVVVPQNWQGKTAKVRFVLTDKAHNRTEIAVDWNAAPGKPN